MADYNEIFCTPEDFVDTLRQVPRSEWPQTLVFEDPADEIPFGQVVRLQWERSRIAQERFETWNFKIIIFYRTCLSKPKKVEDLTISYYAP